MTIKALRIFVDRRRRINTIAELLQCSIPRQSRPDDPHPKETIAMIFAVPEEVSVQTKHSIEQTLKFAEGAAESAEQLFDLNIKTVKAAGGDAVKQIKALAGAKDIQELASLQTAFAQANAEKVAGYAFAAVKSAMGAANQAYDAITKAGKQVADITEATITSAPAAARKKAAA
jgi:phasin family protein